MRNRLFLKAGLMCMFAWAILGGFVGGNASGQEPVVMSAHPAFPPIMYRHGDELKGVGPELTELIFGKLGVDFRNQFVGPWARVIRGVKEETVDAVAGIYKTAEREEFLDYVPTPFMTNPSVVFVKKGNAFPFAKWDDLQGRTGGAIIGESFNAEFNEFLEKHADSIPLERVPSVVLNFRKLLAGRIDFIPYSKYVGLLTVEEMGIAEQIEILPEPIFVGMVYLAVAKTSSLTDKIEAFDREIVQYKEDGTIDTLIEKHIKAYVALKKAGEIE